MTDDLNYFRRRRPRQHPLSGQELQRLLTERDASTVLLTLDRADSGFDLLLQSMSPQKLEDTLRVLAKALVPSAQVAQRQAVINVVTKLLDIAAEPFRHQVWMGLQGRLGRDQNFVQAVTAIVKLALQTSPAQAVGNLALVIISIEGAITNNFPHQHALEAEVEELKDLQRRAARLPALPHGADDEDNAVARRRLRHRDENMDPTMFRQLSIIPTAADFDPAEDIEVRANKVRGGYENVNEYLDVQVSTLCVE